MVPTSLSCNSFCHSRGRSYETLSTVKTQLWIFFAIGNSTPPQFFFQQYSFFPPVSLKSCFTLWLNCSTLSPNSFCLEIFHCFSRKILRGSKSRDDWVTLRQKIDVGAFVSLLTRFFAPQFVPILLLQSVVPASRTTFSINLNGRSKFCNRSTFHKKVLQFWGPFSERNSMWRQFKVKETFIWYD